MSNNRRGFLKQLAAGLSSVVLAGRSSKAEAAHSGRSVDEMMGVLVDTTKCVGCRSCEKACNEINKDLPRKTPDVFKDQTVFDKRRRMDAAAYTVVNRYENPKDIEKPLYTKFQCMHCIYPACESACIVGALTRTPGGAVVYDAWKCIGCRYCMVVCSFQVPTYEYSNAFTPQMRKCTFCFENRLSKGEMPACVQSCPMEAMTFGKRKDLLKMGKEKIRKSSGKYFPHIYGEKEVGGTAWLYMSEVPFEKIDFPRLGYWPVPGYTEPIQNALFKWFLPPLGLFATLGGVMWFLNNKKKKNKDQE